MQKALNFVLGLVLGGMFGSAVALLLAPMSGNRLRTEVKEYTRQVQREVEEAAKARKAELEHELASLRREVVTE